jgi:hypothetical protein
MLSGRLLSGSKFTICMFNDVSFVGLHQLSVLTYGSDDSVTVSFAQREFIAESRYESEVLVRPGKFIPKAPDFILRGIVTLM